MAFLCPGAPRALGGKRKAIWETSWEDPISLGGMIIYR